MTRAAIIGAGFMGNTHAETLRRIGLQELVICEAIERSVKESRWVEVSD